MAKENKIRVRLVAYDHKILDLAVEKILDVAKNTGAGVVGPVHQPNQGNRRITSPLRLAVWRRHRREVIRRTQS